MARHRTFAREEKYPSYFVNAQQDHLSVLAAGFVVTRLNTTTIRVPGGPDNDRAVVAVNGLFRWRDAATDRAHPGGAAGTYAIFAVAKNNSVTNVPVSDTDATDYNFDLRIVADGTTPAIVAGTVDVYRKVATCVWDGAQITRITQLVPASPQHSATHATGGTDPLSPADIGAATAAALTAETAAREAGDSPYAADRVVTWGSDTNLYRRSANQLGTDDGFVVTRAAATNQAFATVVPGDVDHRFHVDAGGVVQWGTGAVARDTNLYRAGADTLKTDDRLHVVMELAVDGVMRPLSAARIRFQGSSGGAGVVEAWDRISISNVHAFGSFPDPGAGGLYASGSIEAGGNAIVRGNIQAATVGGGTVALVAPGGATYSGYVAWWTPDGLRQAYMGFNANNTGVNLQVERGTFTVTGNRVSKSTRRESNTWAISGDVAVASGDTDYIPPMFADVPAGETLTTVRVRARINSGTSATFDIRRWNAAAGTETVLVAGVVAGTVPVLANVAGALADGDRLYPVVTAVSGAPKNLSITVGLDRAAGA